MAEVPCTAGMEAAWAFSGKGPSGRQGFIPVPYVCMVGPPLLMVDVGPLDVGREAAGERFVSPSQSGKGRRR
jgi:hypothetical protein